MVFFYKKSVGHIQQLTENQKWFYLFLIWTFREYLPISQIDGKIWEAIKSSSVVQIASLLAFLEKSSKIIHKDAL